MHILYEVHNGSSRIKSRVENMGRPLLAGILSLFLILGLVPVVMVSAHGNSESIVYDNTPKNLPGNVVSLGYQATSTSEFGSQVRLAGNARNNPSVEVVMSSWACKSGTWNAGTCITNPGSKFSHPITLNLYEVADDGITVGDLVATKTQSFNMPYRPTADDGTNCNGANAGKWWDGTSCNNGKAFTIEFELSNITLPDEVIAAVAYNTSSYGAQPLGSATPCFTTPQGCFYDSLNVGLNVAPTVGESLPTNDDVYLNSTWAGAYTDGGLGGTGTLRLDTGWTGYLPAIQISATKGNKHHNPKHHNPNWWNHSGQKDNKHKNDNGRKSSNQDKRSSFYSLKED